jgi:hypothetical protein
MRVTFVIKPVHFVNLSRLMIAPEHEKVLRVFDFVGEQKHYSFKRHLSTVNIIAEKQVIGRRWESTVLEEPHQVKKLTMNVANNVNR